MNNHTVWKVTKEQLINAVKSSLITLDEMIAFNFKELKTVMKLREKFSSWYTADDYDNRVENIQSQLRYMQTELPVIVQNIQVTLLPICEQEVDNNFTTSAMIPRQFYTPLIRNVLRALAEGLNTNLSCKETEEDIEFIFNLFEPYKKSL